MLQGETMNPQPNAVGAVELTAGDVIKHKGSKVFTVGPEDPIRQAVQILAEHSLGSLLVVDEQRIVGILSERDILRAIARSFDHLEGMTVADLMTSEVIIGLVDDSLDYVMSLMTSRRIRHLPILDVGGKLNGILSIGDIVKTKALQAEVDIRYLTDYITGQYPV